MKRTAPRTGFGPLFGLMLPLLASTAASCHLMVRSDLQSTQGNQKVHIFHTSDIHGSILPKDTQGNYCSNSEPLQDHPEDCAGGGERLLEYVEGVRRENPKRSLFFDTGDLFQGDSIYTLLQRMESASFPLTDFVKLAGYDAFTLGNHELDDGVSLFERHLTELQQAGIKALLTNTDRFEGEATSLRGRFLDHAVFKVGQNIRILVVALGTPQNGLYSKNGRGLTLKEVCTSERNSKTLRKFIQKKTAERSTNMTIALSHLGLKPDRKIPHFCPEIDLVLGGHSHSLFENDAAHPNRYPEQHTRTELEGTTTKSRLAYLSHTGMELKHLGHVILTFDSKGNYIPNATRGNTVPLKGPLKQPRNPQRARFFDAIQEEVLKASNTKVAEITEDMPLTPCREGGCKLARFVTQKLHSEILKLDPQVDFTAMVSGDIRTDIFSGDLTFGKLVSVVPFLNDFVIVELSRAEVENLFIDSLSKAGSHEGKALLHLSSGTVVGEKTELIDSQGNSISQFRFVSLMGPPFEKASKSTFRIAVTDYVFEGGDGIGRVFQNKTPLAIVPHSPWRLFKKALEHNKARPQRSVLGNTFEMRISPPDRNFHFQ